MTCAFRLYLRQVRRPGFGPGPDSVTLGSRDFWLAGVRRCDSEAATAGEFSGRSPVKCRGGVAALVVVMSPGRNRLPGVGQGHGPGARSAGAEGSAGPGSRQLVQGEHVPPRYAARPLHRPVKSGGQSCHWACSWERRRGDRLRPFAGCPLSVGNWAGYSVMSPST